MNQIFIGGCGRSGTTLLGSILGSHPECLATPESRFLVDAYRRGLDAGGVIDPIAVLDALRTDWRFSVWQTPLPESLDVSLEPSAGYRQVLDRVLAEYGKAIGKPGAQFWIDHTPGNVARIAWLRRVFPDSRFIHLVRDARAVASSVLPLDWGANTASKAARWWLERVSLGIAAEHFYGPETSMRVRYEDLVAEPDHVIRAVCKFGGISYEPSMLDGRGFAVPDYTSGQHDLVGRRPDPSRAGAWRESMKMRDVEVIESIAGDMLEILGYEPVMGYRARKRTRAERFSDWARELISARVVNPLRHRNRIRRSVSRRQ